MCVVSEKMLWLGLANFLFSIHVYRFMTNNTTSVTGIEGTNNHSGAYEFIPGYNVLVLLND
jgi:hypothetical protein